VRDAEMPQQRQMFRSEQPRAKYSGIDFVRSKAVHRAFISARRNSLSRTQQTEEEM
jgi:hypothetical protein